VTRSQTRNRLLDANWLGQWSLNANLHNGGFPPIKQCQSWWEWSDEGLVCALESSSELPSWDIAEQRMAEQGKFIVEIFLKDTSSESNLFRGGWEQAEHYQGLKEVTDEAPPFESARDYATMFRPQESNKAHKNLKKSSNLELKLWLVRTFHTGIRLSRKQLINHHSAMMADHTVVPCRCRYRNGHCLHFWSGWLGRWTTKFQSHTVEGSSQRRGEPNHRLGCSGKARSRICSTFTFAFGVNLENSLEDIAPILTQYLGESRPALASIGVASRFSRNVVELRQQQHWNHSLPWCGRDQICDDCFWLWKESSLSGLRIERLS